MSKNGGYMFRIVSLSISGLLGIFMMSLPLDVQAVDWEQRQAAGIAREDDGMAEELDPGYYGQNGDYYGPYGYRYGYGYGYGYSAPLYAPYYGDYGPVYSPYSSSQIYPNPYAYPGYDSYYYPGMYNPNITFENPPL